MFCGLLHGQNEGRKIFVKSGYGYFNGFHTGLNYFYSENRNAGIGIGSHFKLSPLKTPNHFVLYLEHNFHFGKENKQGVKAWIFNQQIMYWEQGASYHRWKIMSLGVNIGRIIAITENLGLGLEIGPAFNLVLDVDRHPTVEQSGWIWPILPNGRLQFIYLL